MSNGSHLVPENSIKKDELLRILQEELEDTNRGLLALTVELENARDLYQDLFDNAFDGIYQANFSGRYSVVNASVARILGYKNSTQVVSEIHHIGNDLYGSTDRFDELIRLLMETGFVSNFVSQVRRADGGTAWISENLRLLRDNQGKPIGFQGVMRDISCERVAEENLRLIAKVFEYGVEGIMIMDREYRIMRVNKAFTDITGFRAEDVLGRTPDMFNTDHPSEFYTDMWREIAHRGYWQGELRSQRSDGTLYTEILTLTEVRNAEGDISNYIAMFSDISERKAAEMKVRRMAYYDLLTGLPNRTLFEDRLAHEIMRANREHELVGVIFIDLDNFKYVNDSYGHRAGDDLLREVAMRLQEGIRESDTVARLGGDEFTVLVAKTRSLRDVDVVALRIVEALQSPCEVNGSEYLVTASLGISVFPRDAKDGETLLKNADAAMYRAKEHGKNHIEYFTQELNLAVSERIRVESSLRAAVQRGEFVLHYQPQLEFDTRRMRGVEALIRWDHPQLGILPPDRFIRVAEECGLVDQIGSWVIHEACRQARYWQDRGIDVPCVAVNISVRHFTRGDIVQLILDALRQYGLQAHQLEIEITESVMMTSPERSTEILERLRRAGVKIVIDDFGTGFSSLSYLKRLPVDSLKIDKSFVRDLITDPDDRAIVASIIDLAGQFQLSLVAEGVESEAQMNMLKKLGCTSGQGYHFSSACNVVQLEKWLKNDNG